MFPGSNRSDYRRLGSGLTVYPVRRLVERTGDLVKLHEKGRVRVLVKGRPYKEEDSETLPSETPRLPHSGPSLTVEKGVNLGSTPTPPTLFLPRSSPTPLLGVRNPSSGRSHVAGRFVKEREGGRRDRGLKYRRCDPLRPNRRRRRRKGTLGRRDEGLCGTGSPRNHDPGGRSSKVLDTRVFI